MLNITSLSLSAHGPVLVCNAIDSKTNLS